MPTRRRNILFLSRPGRSSPSRVRDLSLLGMVTAVEPGSAPAVLPPPDVVVAANPCADDLAEHDAWQTAILPFRKSGIPIVALLDDPTSDRRAKAVATGADVVLAGDARMDEVAAAIRRLGGRAGEDPDAAGTTLGAAMDRAVFGLADVMRAVACGATVEPDEATRLSDLLTRTVREAGSLRTLETIAAIHEPTYRHCMLVAGVMASFIVRHGLCEDEAALLTRGSIVHDIGKALLPTGILDKASSLTTAERAVVERHPSLGFDFLRDQGLFDPPTLQIVRSHHEYLDGSGYPDRLSGHQIPDHVRLSTICDVFTALVEPRPYRPPMPPASAFEIMDEMGAKLDPAFLGAFKAVLPPPARRVA